MLLYRVSSKTTITIAHYSAASAVIIVDVVWYLDPRYADNWAFLARPKAPPLSGRCTAAQPTTGLVDDL